MIGQNLKSVMTTKLDTKLWEKLNCETPEGAPHERHTRYVIMPICYYWINILFAVSMSHVHTLNNALIYYPVKNIS